VRRRFYVDSFAGDRARLAGEDAHHLGRVLHAEPGQLYELSDGSSVFTARIERISPNQIDFSLVEKLPVSAAAASPEIVVLLAIVKFDRFEWALEKATELGADAIVPLTAERSAKALVMAAPKRAERWRKILRESAQQARRLRPPVLEAAMRAGAAFAEAAAGLKILFSERASAAPARVVFEGAASQGKREAGAGQVTLAFGPEGGWTEEEFEAAAAAGFQEASLGRNILRTETAVIAGLAATRLYFDSGL